MSNKKFAMDWLKDRQPPPTHNPIDCQRKRSSHRLCIIIGILFVIGIVAVGYLYWLYFGWF